VQRRGGGEYAGGGKDLASSVCTKREAPLKDEPSDALDRIRFQPLFWGKEKREKEPGNQANAKKKGNKDKPRFRGDLAWPGRDSLFRKKKNGDRRSGTRSREKKREDE